MHDLGSMVGMAVVLAMLAVPVLGVVYILWYAWRENGLNMHYAELVARQEYEREAERRLRQKQHLRERNEVILEEYERGYAGVHGSEPFSPWLPELEEGNDEQSGFVADARTAYSAGWRHAAAGAPDRVKVWRAAGGTPDGQLPKLDD